MRKRRPPLALPPVPTGYTGSGKPIPKPTGEKLPGQQYRVATDQADSIRAFLASGGYSFWPVPAELPPEPFDPSGDGAQLVTSSYVPDGHTGFIKEVRIAPLKPSLLVDAWAGNWHLNPGYEAIFESIRSPINTYTGLWSTPLAWEAYDTVSGAAQAGGFVPSPWVGQLAWEWSITLVQGPLVEIRSARNLPPFDFAIPTSWYLVESIPVPASVYRGGFPGGRPGQNFGPQRFPALPGDPLETHIVVPSNTTICLWARWNNRLDDPVLANPDLQYSLTDGTLNSTVYFPENLRMPIIGPSVGSLHGYIQPNVSRGSNDNAVLGW